MRARATRRSAALCGILLCCASQPAPAQITDVKAPNYTAVSVVNAATQRASGLAPYTIATVYGSNLSFTTRALLASDIPTGSMPKALDGVQVLVNRMQTALFYVSPGQINFVVPVELLAGDYELQVVRNSVNGPVITVHLENFAPGLFVYNGQNLIATHANGQLITDDLPTHPGEVIVVYAVGLGPTNPRQKDSFTIPSGAVALAKSSPLQVMFDGIAVGTADILYAGVTPSCAGLYQINLRVPAGTSARPNVSVSFGSISSPAAALSSVTQ